MGENQVPVVHVEQGGDGIAPQPGEIDEAVGAGAAEEGVADQVERERGHDEEERRQQPPGPASPEGGQVDAARADPLLQQERGDQEAGEDEEQVDPEVATLGPPELEVVRHHADDRHAAQAVQGGEVPAGDRGRGRRRRPARGAPRSCPSHALQPAGGGGLSNGPQQKVGSAGQEGRHLVAGGEVESDRAGSPRPAGRARLAAACTGKCGPSLDRLPGAPQSPAEGDRLRQRLGERRGEAQDAPPPADEVEARDVAGEQGRVTPSRAQSIRTPSSTRGTSGAEPGRQDDRVTQGALAQEDGGCTLRTGPGRLRTQPGRVIRLEEPSFHGEAG